MIVHTFADLINARVTLNTPHGRQHPEAPALSWRIVAYSHHAFTLESLNTPERKRHRIDADVFRSALKDDSITLDLST